jgi:hypothetical protein
MKAKKALKRLEKIEALTSDLMYRYSSGGPQVRAALQDAKAALGRANQAINSQASSETEGKGSRTKKKVAGKKAGAKASSAKTAKKKASNKKAAKAEAAKKTALPAVSKAPASLQNSAPE